MSDTVAFRYVNPMLLEPIAPFDEVTNKQWEASGYDFVQGFGREYGMEMRVYAKSGESLWVMVISDQYSVCQIEVRGWRLFLELMGRYCPIMLAANPCPSE